MSLLLVVTVLVQNLEALIQPVIPTCSLPVLIAAGLAGIKNKILPPAPTDVNIYHLSEEERKSRGIEMLPGSLIEANDELLKDKVICDALGPLIVENLSKIAIAGND